MVRGWIELRAVLWLLAATTESDLAVACIVTEAPVPCDNTLAVAL